MTEGDSYKCRGNCEELVTLKQKAPPHLSELVFFTFRFLYYFSASGHMYAKIQKKTLKLLKSSLSKMMLYDITKSSLYFLETLCFI